MKKILYLLLFTTAFSFAQTGDNDPTFNPTDIGFGNGDGASNGVYTTAVQSDGKIIIGGEFITYNGTARNRIARLNADGSLDATFNPGTGTNNIVRTTAVQSDGKIIIGGEFTGYNNSGRNRIARILNCTTPNVTLTGTNTICSAAIQVSLPLAELLIYGVMEQQQQRLLFLLPILMPLP